MSNQATVAGVDAVNKARQAEVLAKAQSLINGIVGNNGRIKEHNEQIVYHQGVLKEMAEDVVTQKSVLGADFTGPLNPNQATIAEAIKKINEAKQASVSLNAQHQTNAVLREQAAIKLLENSNADLRNQLNELAVDVVTITTVAGPTA